MFYDNNLKTHQVRPTLFRYSCPSSFVGSRLVLLSLPGVFWLPLHAPYVQGPTVNWQWDRRTLLSDIVSQITNASGPLVVASPARAGIKRPQAIMISSPSPRNMNEASHT